jgi:hypothetical protein
VETAPFDSTKMSLQDLLKSIKEGKLQLPDFQRGWVWDSDHIKSLLASVSLSFPIGAVMLLQTGNPDVRFKPRLIEGLQNGNSAEPEFLILDGQQRLTSLFQALLLGEAVKTRDSKGKPIERWYYVDIQKALDPNGDREEAIVAVPRDKMVKDFQGNVVLDCSSNEKEWALGYLPLGLVFDMDMLFDWHDGYQNWEGPEKHAERGNRYKQLYKTVIQPFNKYHVPVITLFKENPKEAVCQVFEKVNTGGVSLTVFELLTATFAADDFSLRDDWISRDKKLRVYPVLQNTGNDDFLQAITLLTTYDRRKKAIQTGTESAKAPGVSCKRKDVLRLTLQDYQSWAEKVTDGFVHAAKFMQEQRVFSARDLPYRTQLIPLAAVFVALGSDSEKAGVLTKLAKWYWCGVFGELYGGAIETRFAKDLPEILDWVSGGPEPDTIGDANFAASRLLSLRTRNSAAYKGIYAKLLKHGCYDFLSGSPIEVKAYFDDRIDIHHIFPQVWCKKNDVPPKLCDSIVNKTAIGAKPNRMIGGRAPSLYLTTLEKKAEISQDQIDEILRSHRIAPEHLRSDDFHGFFKDREEALIQIVEESMGKKVIRDVVEEEAEPEVTEFEQEDSLDYPTDNEEPVS